MWALLTIPVLWLAAAAAFAYEDGMTVFDWMEAFSQVMGSPLYVRWTADTPGFLLGALALYAFAIALY